MMGRASLYGSTLEPEGLRRRRPEVDSSAALAASVAFLAGAGLGRERPRVALAAGVVPRLADLSTALSAALAAAFEAAALDGAVAFLAAFLASLTDRRLSGPRTGERSMNT